MRTAAHFPPIPPARPPPTPAPRLRSSGGRPGSPGTSVAPSGRSMGRLASIGASEARSVASGSTVRTKATGQTAATGKSNMSLAASQAAKDQVARDKLAQVGDELWGSWQGLSLQARHPGRGFAARQCVCGGGGGGAGLLPARRRAPSTTQHAPRATGAPFKPLCKLAWPEWCCLALPRLRRWRPA
jgi:hypothetical protein